MNPLSIWTYWRRHKGRTALIAGLVALAAGGLYATIAAVLVLFHDPLPAATTFLRNGALLSSTNQRGFDPGVVARIRTHPDVAQVVADNGFEIAVPDLISGSQFPFYLMPLNEETRSYIMQINGVTLKAGRLPAARTNEVVLSQEIATALGLQIGDELSRAVDPIRYMVLEEPLQLVGILQGEVRLGLVSADFMGSMRNRLLVLPKVGCSAALDQFLVDEIADKETLVESRSLREAHWARKNGSTNLLFAPIALLLSIVLTIVIGVIQRLDVTRRLAELGTLHIMGLPKSWLLRRLTWENILLALMGWLAGLLIPTLILLVLNLRYFAPTGLSVSLIQWPAFWLTLPIPSVVILYTVIAMRRLFIRLDSIAIIERGELENQNAAPPAAQHPPKRSASNPLSSYTFYQRYRRRALLVSGAATLMIMAVALLIFTYTTYMDSTMVSLGNKRLMSVVLPLAQDEVDAGLLAQIRAQPSVARIVPAAELSPLSISVPPFIDNGISTFAVAEEDLRYLVELYGLQIKEGRLPNPRTNELIVAEAVAINRNLHIGDVVGDYDAPLYEGVPAVSSPFVISGIFVRPAPLDAENWLSFASLEFVQSYEGFHEQTKLLVVAQAGQKSQLDSWLEEHVTDGRNEVITYQEELAAIRSKMQSTVVTLTVIEGVVALIGAIALAVLNYIFVGQRQAEFGVLHALGYGRRWLVWRVIGETLFTTASAWGVSMLLCLVGLIALHVAVFQPRGVSVNFYNPLPWFFTLPVPVAVLLVSAATVHFVLKRLDPVAVIEKA